MKAGLFNKRCTILRKQVVTGDYRDKEVWTPVFQTKVNFVWTAGDRRIEQPTSEIFFSKSATITLRSYVDIQEEDHVEIDGVEYRVISLHKDNSTTHNCITAKIDKINQ